MKVSIWHLWLLLCLLNVATCPNAQSRSHLSVDQHTLQPETLSAQQRQEIYLRLIENFVGWTEQSERFSGSEDDATTSAGCFDAAGNGVSWARGNSNLCIAYAVLLTSFPQRAEFSIYRIPRSTLEDHLRKTIRTLCLSNKNCARHQPGRHTWGGPSWQAALEIIGCAWSAHLYEQHLDEDTRNLVREVVCREADHLEKEIPSRRFDDTGAEDCCWNAPLLAFAANKYADDPRAARWEQLGTKWAFNAASIPADANSSKMVDGRPLSDWIVSENLHPDLTLENHAMWSVGYQCSQQHFGEAELAYRVFARSAPAAFAHHADDMWRRVTSVLYLWDGDLLFPHGQDWSWKVYSSVEYLCWQHCCRRNQAAGAMESRALQMIYRRQLALGSGDLGAAVSSALDFGNQTVKPKRWAFCYLMHKHFPGPEPIPFAEAEKAVLGVHVYPFTKVAIHRTREKCVSVSWHPRHQPVYVLPEGNSTFTDPPFFFPYDGDSGCVRVQTLARVTSKHTNPRHPADFLIDGDPSTFWISGVGNSRPGDGPTSDRPDWLQIEFPEPLKAASLLLRPRENYGPRDVELQIPVGGQEEFKTIARFSATNETRQLVRFPQVEARVFRIVILSAYDPRYPEQPRNAQIREIEIRERESEGEAKSRLARPVLDQAAPSEDGKGMRVSYRKPHPGGVVQHVTVISLADEATVYGTVFQAHQTTSVKVGRPFPLRAAAPPGFEKSVGQYRGERWLNMSDHVGFVSVDLLPREIPNDEFYLGEEQTYHVQPGQWFGRAVLAVYARQSREQTAHRATSVRLMDNALPEKFKVLLESSTGSHVLEFDFAQTATPHS
jgi:hypothetical protein